jgi:AcrR family transcriptional regulator
LSRERILRTAMELADAGGLASLSMRKLAQTLGVEAMSLYHYVANKDDLLDGLVDLVFSEISLPPRDIDWKMAMRRRAITAREVLGRHPWSIGLLESRHRPGPATLAHHDAVIGFLKEAGFSVAMTAHAYSLLDSYIYGFALQQASMPLQSPQEVVEVVDIIMRQFPTEAHPYLAEFTLQHVLQPGYDYAQEFDFGLDLILDGLECVRNTSEESRT